MAQKPIQKTQFDTTNLGGGAAAVWGGITGDITTQTDLKTQLAGKQSIIPVQSGVPSGTATDWVTSGTLKRNSSTGALWVATEEVAQVPVTSTNNGQYVKATTAVSARLGLAEAGWAAAWAQNDATAGTIWGTTGVVSSEQVAEALTMTVLQRDKTAFDTILASLAKFSRSGQTSAKSLYGSLWDNTSKTLTNVDANAGDNLQIMGALIRAWNLWSRQADADLASAIAAGLKSNLYFTDESRGYLQADTNASSVAGSKRKIEVGKLSPVIFRMAKTFTGDAIFDTLVTGYYDAVNKSTANEIGSSAGLFPRYAAYDTSSHHVMAVTTANGFPAALSTSFDRVAGNTLFHLYADYKMYSTGGALSILNSSIKTFFTQRWTSANGQIFQDYNHDGSTNSPDEDVRRYWQVAYSLTANDDSNATWKAIYAKKMPTDLFTTGGTTNRYYYSNYVNDEAGPAYANIDDDVKVWLHNSLFYGLYFDIALIGTNANAGSTGSTGGTSAGGTTTTPTTGGTSTTTTPPASNGIAIADFYPYGVAPSLSVSARRTLARQEYDKFIGSDNFYVTTGMPSGVTGARIQVPDEANDRYKTNSEGTGYGMLLTVIYGNPNLPSGIYDPTAKGKFDALWAYCKYYINKNGVMNWLIDKNGNLLGTGGATDGDLDIALALVLAHRTWGSAGAINYGAEATKMINGLKNFEYTPAGIMTNGDQWGMDNDTYFQDYFRPAHLREFYWHTGDAAWLNILSVNFPIALGTFYNTGKGASNINGLTTDIKRNGDRAGYGGPILGYNNIRYPWTVALDYVTNGTYDSGTNPGGTDPLAYNSLKRMIDRAKVVLGTNPVAAPGTDSNGNPTYNPYGGASGIVAEPAIDYSYWNGNYRNSAYVQAYTPGALTDASHTAWGVACMNWINADTEVNYFGRSLSALTMTLMAGLFQLGRPATAGTTTSSGGTGTVTTPTDGSGSGNTTPAPSGALKLYSNPGTQAANYAKNLAAGTKKDRYNWFTSQPSTQWAGIDWDPDCSGIAGYINNAIAANKVPQVLSYSIPGRDLGQYSSGGATNTATYEAWIKKFALAIGSNVCIMAYEPDSLVQLDSLGSDDLKNGRVAAMTWAIRYLKQNCPNLYLYVDVGHSGWKSVDDAARLLQLVHVENADGFVINVSNFRPDAELITYGQAICAKLNLPNIRFIYDSGRNGNATNLPSGFANPALRRLGKLPQFGNTNVDKCDGWLWWKSQGESDGDNGSGAPSAGQFWDQYMYNDSKGDNDNGNNSTDTSNVPNSSGMLQRPPTYGVANGS